jgi:hypothetical protein
MTTKRFPQASQEKREAAYQRQQEQMAIRHQQTTDRMRELVELYDSTGETDKADFYRDLLADRAAR